MSWQDNANCIGIDTEMFFPVADSGSYSSEDYLRKMCNNCEVKKNCLDFALNNLVQGWWAGTVDSQRAKMRQQLGISGQSIVVSDMDILADRNSTLSQG